MLFTIFFTFYFSVLAQANALLIGIRQTTAMIIRFCINNSTEHQSYYNSSKEILYQASPG